MMLVSIIIPVHNEDSSNIKRTIESIKTNTSYRPYEIIVVDDGSENNCCGFLKNYNDVRFFETKHIGPSRARNLGAEKAEGEFLVFLDSHMLIKNRNWLASIVKFLKLNKKSICSVAISDINKKRQTYYGFTIKRNLREDWTKKKSNKPYQIPVAPGACLTVRKRDFFQIDGFNSGFKEWGHEDVELSIKAWLLGFDVWLLPNIEIGHLFRNEPPRSFSQYTLNKNALRLAFTYFSFNRVKRVLGERSKHRGYTRALISVLLGSVWMKRREFMKKRARTDDWLCKKFKLDI